MEAELLRMLKSCASFGFHTPLQVLLSLCPSGADECFVIACQEGKLRCLDVLLASKEPKLSRKVLTDGMQEACKHNRMEIVARLIDVADINVQQHPSTSLLLLCITDYAYKFRRRVHKAGAAFSLRVHLGMQKWPLCSLVSMQRCKLYTALLTRYTSLHATDTSPC